MWGPVRRGRGCSEPTGTLGECPAEVHAWQAAVSLLLWQCWFAVQKASSAFPCLPLRYEESAHSPSQPLSSGLKCPLHQCPLQKGKSRSPSHLAAISADSKRFSLPWAWLSRAGKDSSGLQVRLSTLHVKSGACRPAPASTAAETHGVFCSASFPTYHRRLLQTSLLPCQGTPCTLCCCSAFHFFCCGPQDETIRVWAGDNHLKGLHHQTLQVVSVSPSGMDILHWMWIAPRIIPSSRCYETWRHMDPESPHLEMWAFSGGIRAQARPKGLWIDEAFSARQIQLTCSVWCWCYSHIPHVACCCDGGLMFRLSFSL